MLYPLYNQRSEESRSSNVPRYSQRRFDARAVFYAAQIWRAALASIAAGGADGVVMYPLFKGQGVPSLQNHIKDAPVQDSQRASDVLSS